MVNIPRFSHPKNTIELFIIHEVSYMETFHNSGALKPCAQHGRWQLPFCFVSHAHAPRRRGAKGSRKRCAASATWSISVALEITGQAPR